MIIIIIKVHQSHQAEEVIATKKRTLTESGEGRVDPSGILQVVQEENWFTSESDILNFPVRHFIERRRTETTQRKKKKERAAQEGMSVGPKEMMDGMVYSQPTEGSIETE